MSSIPLQLPDAILPTLSNLNATLPPDLDAKQVARDWFSVFSGAIEAKDASAVANLLLPDSFWRDFLALTWDFRTFHGQDKITQFLKDQLPVIKVRNIKLKDDYLGLQQPYPDFAWINTMFDFETDVGIGSGIVRLVPTHNGDWKAHVVFTNMEDLKGFPEKIGALRNPLPNHGLWEQQRRKEAEFKDTDPTVLIIGAGQSGLEMAARLKALGVSALIVEKNSRIGDNWRNRYEALCLHDPVWYDHMPYMPFPSTWPVYSPSQKLANWLEYYAEALELPVWLSTNITSVSQDENNKWHVKVKRGEETERAFTVNHLVFATGLGGGVAKTYPYAGLDKFKGQYLHSTEHKRALDHAGKKVVIVGACTSAHDIAADYHAHGIDVTMVQRGPTYIMSCKNGWDVLFKGLYSEDAPPADIADRLNASFPHFMAVGIQQRKVKEIAELDKELLNGLRSVGFKLTDGIKGTGFALLAWSKAGGYYLDTGTSQLIIDKKIKLKSDSMLSEVTETGLKFEDGSELPTDVIIFATGLGDSRDVFRNVCGDEIAEKVKRIWGLNSEGEIYGAWRDVGVPNLWYMMGNLALCRFHSKHVALQIKATEEGLFGRRYSAQEE
ncbi:FAD/NAD(P)-binding domain-containing protein [Macrolepiota fuliginosa MF-IS2]|uniref:FAD/NAD(P)-binding domain-containing protein n=1 Tax=Macrolepiota fuliginosa MF-IS2 TaxID=1400762 RepID=A0A9P6C1Y5_9AGAR|nr:FAD/NAD(P)-binding domain-containing protein [Macrolepiota fuliginosa MF-IS2]